MMLSMPPHWQASALSLLVTPCTLLIVSACAVGRRWRRRARGPWTRTRRAPRSSRRAPRPRAQPTARTTEDDSVSSTSGASTERSQQSAGPAAHGRPDSHGEPALPYRISKPCQQRQLLVDCLLETATTTGQQAKPRLRVDVTASCRQYKAECEHAHCLEDVDWMSAEPEQSGRYRKRCSTTMMLRLQ